ncbi:carboxypeptidase-like regulatory domain-containing protein [Paraburkholderia sprentiae WSM5005]|uniref:Carboxypeptidase-like regulatory domain-containing protein n=1 Tax=Paraburkholderia sprentiae WSM5005 TaxID=754502 RepID=A0A1I9YN40_9BURK|nr:carboxypeptidase-like regulatory domain-containing protein [Paraburkholderia sprentiae]APA87723.1 carboxypeptidase-like regulatory domain-containing protein [Paraburkholderia sprentiae WSM5005]
MKMQRNAPRIASTLLAAAFTLVQAGVAVAQTSAPETASEIHRTGMPPTQQQGDISFVTGGVGRDESTALRQARRQWPLSLQFTGPGASYVADVQVQVAKAGGTAVLDTTSHGPYLLARLPPGRYTVSATYSGVTRRQSVNVRGNGSARATFAFPSSH